MSAQVDFIVHYKAVKARLEANTVEPRRVLVITRTFPAGPAVIYTMPIGPRKYPRWKEIILDVCAGHDIPTTDLESRRRSKRITACRHEVFYRLRRETSMSMAEIGRRLGFDHTSVIHGSRKFARENGLPL